MNQQKPTDNEINLKSWGWHERLTPAQVACLFEGKDPEKYISPTKVGDIIQDTTVNKTFKMIKTWCTLWQQFSQTPFWYVEKALSISDEIKIYEPFLDEIKAIFLKKFKDNSKKAMEDFPNLSHISGLSTQENKDSNCPFCKYSTHLLEITGWAIQEFWLDYDRQKPPKKAHIISSLREKGITQAEAIAIDKIIRHKDRKPGGKTTIKSKKR